MREKLIAAVAITGGCALLYLLLHFKNSSDRKSKSSRKKIIDNKVDSKSLLPEKKFSEKGSKLDSPLEEVKLEANSSLINRENIYETIFSEETNTNKNQMNLLEKESSLEQINNVEEKVNITSGNCGGLSSTLLNQETDMSSKLAVVDFGKTATDNELILQSQASSSSTLNGLAETGNLEVCYSVSSDYENNLNADLLTCLDDQGVDNVNSDLVIDNECNSVTDKRKERNQLLVDICYESSCTKGNVKLNKNIEMDDLALIIPEDVTVEIKEVESCKSDITVVDKCDNINIDQTIVENVIVASGNQVCLTEKPDCSFNKINEKIISSKGKRQRRKGKLNNVSNENTLQPESLLSNEAGSEDPSKSENSLINNLKACDISDSNEKNSILSLCHKNENLNIAANQEPSCTSDLEREATPEQENGTSDSHSLVSQGSCDSGQGSIEVEPDTVFGCSMLRTNTNTQYIFYQFEIPQHLVGRLIGKRGAFINKIKAATSTTIVVLEHSNTEFKICSIEGQKPKVIQALEMVRNHFPLDQFPDLTLAQTNSPSTSPHHQPRMNRQILQVELPPGVVAEVQASAIVSTGEVWLQQPLHPTFSALQRLHQCLNLNYGDGTSTPALPLPIPPNTVCVCKIGTHWLRCQIQSHDQLMCTATLLDIGGVVTFPISLLRQIRVDYVGLPFQAAQSFLYGIEPLDEGGWNEEGRLALNELVKDRIIFAAIAAYTQEGIPLVNLYQRNNNQYVNVNEKLVELGHARWISAIPELESTS